MGRSSLIVPGPFSAEALVVAVNIRKLDVIFNNVSKL